jgi:hypothetical protein
MLKVSFEFTAPNTPQQNGKVERKFATLYGKVRSMLNSAKLTPWLRGQFWAYAALHATNIENVIVDANGQTAYEKVWKKEPKWVLFIRQFGEVGIVYNNLKIKSKLMDRTHTCVFIGHPNDHAPDVYMFYNVNTKSVLLSRNVVWLNKLYGDYKGFYYKGFSDGALSSTGSKILDDIDDMFEDSSPKIPPLAPIDPGMTTPPRADSPIPTTPLPEVTTDTGTITNDDTDHSITTSNTPTTPLFSPRVKGIEREIYNLTTSYNPDPKIHMEDLVHLALTMTPGMDIYPSSYHDAMNRKDNSDWWSAMKI